MSLKKYKKKKSTTNAVPPTKMYLNSWMNILSVLCLNNLLINLFLFIYFV